MAGLVENEELSSTNWQNTETRDVNKIANVSPIRTGGFENLAPNS